MSPIEHKVKAIKQRTSECLQTSAAQLINCFGEDVSVQQVLDAVPVYIENGEKIGTSPGHLASFFPNRGYKTVVHIFDVELFDLSWEGLAAQEVVANLQQRQAYIPANSWLAKYHHVLVDGWKQYAEAGGSFSFPQLDNSLLYGLLQQAPFLVMVNSTYLNRQAKQVYDEGQDTFVVDPIRGRSLTHAVVAAGFRDGKFLIVDPDPPAGTPQQRWIESGHLIASIMSAQTEADNFLISISK